MKRLIYVLAGVLMFGLLPMPRHWSAAELAQAASTTNPSTPFADLSREHGELVGMRTRTSRTYQQGGDYVTQISQDSMNYRDANGAWQPIDDSLVPSSTPGYAVQNRANRYTVLFPSDLGQQPVRVQTAGGWVRFSLEGTSGAGTVSGSTDTYSLSDGSIAWTANSDSLKESITLQSAAAPASYVFDVSTSGELTAQQNATGGIDFVNGSGTPQFTIPRPFMTDAAGASSTAVTMTLTHDAAGTQVTLAADPTWLSDPARQYPVVIDPSVSLGTAQTCYLDASYLTTSYCSSADLLTNSTSNKDYQHALLQFNLSAIPQGAQVLSADLSLFCYCTGPTFYAVVYADAVTSSWTSAATWFYRSGTTAWTHAGGDYTTTNEVSVAFSNSTGNPVHWSPTGIVQSCQRILAQ